MAWLPLTAPGVPLPALADCRTVAVFGAEPAAAAALVGALADRGVSLTQADPGVADAVVLLHGGARESLDAAFADLSSIAKRSVHPRLLVSAVQDGLHAAGIAGLTKTAALEWSAAWKCLTLDGPTDRVTAIADELARGGAHAEVRLGRTRAIRTRVSLSVNGHAHRPVTAGPWIVSGGARGVTAACCVELARAGARRMVLLGRSPLRDEPAHCRDARDEVALKRALLAHAGAKPDLRAINREVGALLAQREVRTTMAALEDAGAEVRYFAADIADAGAVGAVASAIRKEWGPIRGVVHGAGVLADKRLGDKTPEQFASVLQPKLDGADALLAACADDPLEQICFFSSVAAQSGNPGQSDYAAANAVLDRRAEQEQAARGSACHVVSIAWGPWAGGMVTESLAKHFTSRGIGLIPQDAGARAFVRELQGGTHTQVIIGCGLDGHAAAAIDEPLHLALHELEVLQDHRISGLVVMPMTMGLDLLMGAARRVLGPSCAMRQLHVLQGVIFNEPHLRLTVRVDAGANGGGLTASLVHPSGRPAYRAEFVRASGAPPAPIDIPPQMKHLPEACRRPYAEALFHGPAFQVIRRVIACTPESITARLATAGAMQWPGVWQIDPAALDGALQLLRVWGFAQDGRASLPTSIEGCRVWAPWPHDAEVVCHLRCVRENALRLRADAVFCDASTGAPLLSLDGITMHVHAS